MIPPIDLTLLPENPGIYKMLNQTRDILYIGKAKNLKKRISSYFKTSHNDVKTSVLVKHITDVETMITKTEKEALILENQLIKSIKPRYNILLKDDKSYPYIKITSTEPFPKIIITREKKNDGGTYFGPYPSIGSTRKLRRLLYDLFPLRDCKQAITLTEKQPKCLLLDIEKCLGPCIYKNIQPIYYEHLDQLKKFLAGRNAHVIRDMTKKMKELSTEQKYEEAAKYRDKIIRLSELNEKQSVLIDDRHTYQIWGFLKAQQIKYLCIQVIVKGKLLFQKGFYEDSHATEEDIFIENSFLDFIETQKHYPDKIICDDSVHQVLKRFLKISESTQFLVTPKAGEKKQLLMNAHRNAQIGIDRITLSKLKSNSNQSLIQLKESLKLKILPIHILGFDISHLQGTHIVASAVCFENGFPNKSKYRKYNIKTVKHQSNDPASMKEVVYRRLQECVKHNQLPHLLLIDGGKAQLNFACKAVHQLNLQNKLSIVALAKRNEEIYLPNQEHVITLKRSHPGLQLLQKVRDEAHRFAVGYQRKQRLKTALISQFMTIPGIGQERLKKIRTEFPTLSELKKCNLAELQKKLGFSLKICESILKSIENY